jgi:hypothetical protein
VARKEYDAPVFAAGRYLIYIALALVLGITPLLAQGTRAEFDTQVNGTLTKLNAEAVGLEGTGILADMIQREYEAPIAELQWAATRGISWGSIAALAYIRATTGESFEVLDRKAAPKNLWAYAESAGMNPEKMVRSLSQLLKRVEEERNTRIFERVRSNRRVTRMPDLGSGFGLLQETLDFRRLETPPPTKSHTNPELLEGK